MISLIVCSKLNKALNNFQSNVDETIGTEYEILPIENSLGRIGICEAYNVGAKHAKFPYLCFIHEDVKFIKRNWGKNLLNHFQSEKSAGVIGIAGSTYKVRMVSSWWQPAVAEIEAKRANYVQAYKQRLEESRIVYFNPNNERRSKVVTLDGVFLASKKEVWKQFKFDDKMLKGFHGYDLDFTLRVGSQFDNFVVYDILLEHFSEGVNDKSWLRENYLVHRKNKHLLPTCNNKQIGREALREVEKGYLERNFKLAVDESMPKVELITMILSMIINSRLMKPNVPFLKQFMKKLVLF